MKTDPQERSLASISGILLLVVSFGGALFLERPFESQRPDPVEAFKSLGEELEDVDARLWEDPLRTVYEHQRTTDREDHDHAVNRLASQLGGALAGEGSGAVAIQLLGVMIPGGPYPEDVERRRRRRTALLSGLALAGFVPSRSERIGYFDHHPESDVEAHAATWTVPFEWLELESPHPELPELPSRVLILWLDEGHLRASPLAGIAGFFRQVLEGSGSGADVRLRLLGPASSDTLRAMIRDSPPDAEDASILGRLRVHSPWATASEELLFDPARQESPGEAEEAEATDRAIQKALGVGEFRSTVLRDDRLAERLVEELVHRDVDLADLGEKDSKIRVVLVSEWDTLDGRALPEAFSRALERRLRDECKKECGTEVSTRDSDHNHHDRLDHIWRYTYLRGLDGHGSQWDGGRSSERSAGSSGTEGGRPDRSSTEKRLERAVGPSQLDALRRLATDLQNRAAAKGVQIRAIGVLGSDLYDKQLILQAFRSRFRRAVFFTTDLDARFLHPASYRWSRNLVVASSYGLDPVAELPESCPLLSARTWRTARFRDAYQVSTFRATLWALNPKLLAGSETTAEGAEPGDRLALEEPRVFEVGRRGAVPLSAHRPEGSLALLLGALGLGAGGVVLLTVAPLELRRRGSLVRPAFQDRAEKAQRILVLSLGALVFIGLWWLAGHSLEPLYFGQGVSIWPTQMVRVLALVVCWLLLLRAQRELTDNSRRLEEDLGLPEEVPDPLSLTTRWSRWWCRWEGLRQARLGGQPVHEPRRLGLLLAFFTRIYRWIWPARWKGGFGKEVSVARCWRRYRHLSHWRYRLERIGPMGLGYLLFGILVAGRLGRPFVPARGGEAFLADKVVLIVSVLSMLTLTFFVLDQTLLCRALIRHLRGGPSRWPKEALRKFSRRYRLPEETVPTLIDTHFIADLTAVSGRLVLYPFVVFTLMMVARHRIFDGWDWPLGLLLILGVMVSLVAGCALILRREAEEARKTSLDRLRYRLFQALDEEDEESRGVREKQLRLAQEEVAQLRRGAFGHWSQHPVLRAVLLPFGSLGLLSLVEALSLLGL